MPLSVNFSYKSFGNTEDEEDEYCFVHGDTIIFNQDVVERVSIETGKTRSSFLAVMRLVNGDTETKTFDVDIDSVVERRT